jgi:hypothetical protein
MCSCRAPRCCTRRSTWSPPRTTLSPRSRARRCRRVKIGSTSGPLSQRLARSSTGRHEQPRVAVLIRTSSRSGWARRPRRCASRRRRRREPRLLPRVRTSHEAKAAGRTSSGQAHAFEAQGHTRSRRGVFHIDHSRRDSLGIEPEDHVPPPVVSEDVPDLQCRKAHPAAGVSIDMSDRWR